MFMRKETLHPETGAVVTTFDYRGLGGWPDVATASRELTRKAEWLDPEPLICGGYETRKAHPGHMMRERVSFWVGAA